MAGCQITDHRRRVRDGNATDLQIFSRALDTVRQSDCNSDVLDQRPPRPVPRGWAAWNMCTKLFQAKLTSWSLLPVDRDADPSQPSPNIFDRLRLREDLRWVCGTRGCDAFTEPLPAPTIASPRCVAASPVPAISPIDFAAAESILMSMNIFQPSSSNTVFQPKTSVAPRTSAWYFAFPLEIATVALSRSPRLHKSPLHPHLLPPNLLPSSHTHIHIHTHTHTYTDTHTIHIHTHTYIHTHAHTYTHNSYNIHTHTYTQHTHTYTHIQRGTSAVPHSKAQRETRVYTQSTCLHCSHVDLSRFAESNRKVVWLSLPCCVRVPSSSDAIQRPTGGAYSTKPHGFLQQSFQAGASMVTTAQRDELSARAFSEATGQHRHRDGFRWRDGFLLPSDFFADGPRPWQASSLEKNLPDDNVGSDSTVGPVHLSHGVGLCL